MLHQWYKTEAKATKLVLFIVPHRCIVPQEFDRGCDAMATTFADIYTRKALKDTPADTAVRLILGNEKRSSCDLNRDTKCSRTSKFRSAIVKAASEFEPENVTIIEVHSFEKPEDFKVAQDVYFVVLTLHEDQQFEKDIAAAIPNCASLTGSSANALGELASKQGWRHVLLESRDDTTITMAFKAGEAIRKVLFDSK